jgi:hypothetical protein
MNRAALVILCIVAAPVFALSANTGSSVTTSSSAAVTTLGAPPQYPGAVRDPAVESETLTYLFANGRGLGTSRTVISAAAIVYVTGDAPETVLAFYMKNLGAVPGDQVDPSKPRSWSEATGLKPGDTRQPAAWINTHQNTTAAKKAMLTKSGRPKLPTGEWLEHSTIDWAVVEADGSQTEYFLYVWDRSFNDNGTAYQQKSVICMETNHYKAYVDPAAGKAAAEKAKAEKAAATMDIGVPIFPGSQYMKDISSALQYVFDSEEDAAKAAAFYLAQTGFKKMMETPGLFIFKGPSCIVQVQSAPVPGVKTRVVIMKQ